MDRQDKLSKLGQESEPTQKQNSRLVAFPLSRSRTSSPAAFAAHRVVHCVLAPHYSLRHVMSTTWLPLAGYSGRSSLNSFATALYDGRRVSSSARRQRRTARRERGGRTRERSDRRGSCTGARVSEEGERDGERRDALLAAALDERAHALLGRRERQERICVRERAPVASALAARSAASQAEPPQRTHLG